MVLLTATTISKAAVEEYCRLKQGSSEDQGREVEERLEELSGVELGSPIDHNDLIDISTFLVSHSRKVNDDSVAKEWRLETLLKGASMYQPAPTPKPEPVRFHSTPQRQQTDN